MAYYNNTDDANFNATPSTYDEFDEYPFLGPMPVTERANYGAPDVLANNWNMSRQPGYMVGASTSLRSEANFDPMPPATPYVAQTNDYGQLSYPDHYWPVADSYAESYRSGIVSRDNSFATTGASEASMVDPTPSSIPFDYWGANESGQSMSTFYADVQTTNQPSAGSTRAGLMPARRFQPYGTPRARSNEHRNAEAGSSTLAPPLVPYMALPTATPPGGLSETTAHAVSNQSITEEGTAPTTRRPRGTGEPREWRIQNSRDIRRLCAWAQEWKYLPKLPSHEKALDVALEAVTMIRLPLYPGPRLLKGKAKRAAQVKKGAKAERKRRKGTRELNEKLSRYYPLPDPAVWTSPELLLKVLNDVEGLPRPPPP